MTDRSDLTAPNILKGDIKNLQLVPAVAIKLLGYTADSNAAIKDLSRIIETEPTLAAKILRNANSAAYALPNKITSIHRAVSLLGFSTVRQIALNQLFYQKLIDRKSRSPFNALFFWQHCLFVASLGKAIALTLKHPEPDLVYAAGLLHDIGKIVLECNGRISYGEFVDSMSRQACSSIHDERQFFGQTHADIGLLFCQASQLPPAITAVIAHHHELPDESSFYAGFKTEIAIVAFADYIAWLQGIGSVQAQYQPVIDPAVLKIIDINKLNLDQLLNQVDLDMAGTREFYGIEFPCAAKLRASLLMNIFSANNRLVESPPTHTAASSMLTHLTLPHKSLNPDEFVPATLAAIRAHFDFDRTMMLTINPQRRSLTASHWQQKSGIDTHPQRFEIDISRVAGEFLSCLREKQAVLIDGQTGSNKALLKQLKVKEFIAIPITYQTQLIAVCYIDNVFSEKPLQTRYIDEIALLTDELGVALSHAKRYQTEKKRAQLDPLTGLYNKRMIDAFLMQLFDQDFYHKKNLAVGFVDIDYFKRLNDSCGHQAGDEALKIVADIMRNLTRPRDYIGRYGGEEFLFILKNTNKSGALGYAERIRLEIEQRGKRMQQRFHNLALTASIGVCLYNPNLGRYTDMIEIADQAMYRAKHEGRNKVVLLDELLSDRHQLSQLKSVR